ncbi:cytochrome c-type biogenesis protein CcmI [Methylocella silvestris BL2]|uniref:Cytochrome c-type biogenesis protein CcmI n=1 Tax=Methylocella silvestris (strain DSM 15510 / CIP 108128 / LMG 27833 / NCIMB 13906 / BL2) TaxID=395965 RepID=B8EJK6_METSB|nr:c-type cytochrome biogenesis protein CcmI [Methylocella silvestris]ACK49410.1 cytochrome c-type biogenesis protein CcmI [Methylocella silvestris BL2]
MLWVFFAALTAAALTSVFWPLLRTPRGPSRSAIDVAFYKAQLAEIERDAARGLVAKHDAEGAKAEAARRLIAASETPGPGAADASQTKARAAIAAAVLFVPALAIGLYSAIGHPGLPDLPLTARLAQPAAKLDIMAAIGKVEAHLAENPNDARGYAILAPIYMRLGRYEDAAKAYAAMLRLEGETAERLSLYGEALVAAAQGDVTAEAKTAFESAVAKDPAAPRPRFYLGLAAAEAGDKTEAKKIWTELLAQSPPDAPYAPALREKLAALDGAPAPAAPGPAQNPALAANIAGMAGPEQAQAIKGMVDRLAAKLAENGQDVEGWLRLVRAYAVLHESEKARSAVVDAKRNLAGDATASARIDALARELGLEG